MILGMIDEGCSRAGIRAACGQTLSPDWATFLKYFNFMQITRENKLFAEGNTHIMTDRQRYSRANKDIIGMHTGFEGTTDRKYALWT